tara:strand:+ start:1159 stop:1329 length:171 start_codon:yes stop_codon:yes gene_type:complete
VAPEKNNSLISLVIGGDFAEIPYHFFVLILDFHFGYQEPLIRNAERLLKRAFGLPE